MTQIISIAAAVGLAFLFVKLISAPIRLAAKLLINAGCGFGVLFLLNMVSDVTGVVFQITFLSSAIVGFLGIPGIILLLVLPMFL